MGVGSHEEGSGIPGLDAFGFVTNLRAMAQRLEGRVYTSFRQSHVVFDDETHNSVVAPVLTRGLRRALGRRPPMAV